MRLKYPILLDGGLSNVLMTMGCQVNHKLWTAHLLDKEADNIIKAHIKYLEAGAKCITSASYQASIPGFMESGYSQKEAELLLLKSVDLADKAIKIYFKNQKKDKILIAASIGPYGAYLADGSEYKGRYKISEKELLEFHRARFRVLEKSRADIYACETIPNIEEARVLNTLTRKLSKAAWVSFVCKDDKNLVDNTHIGECVSLFKDNKNILAVGVNCTDPTFVSGLIKEIKKADSSQKIIVYPNSGESYDPASKRWSELANTSKYLDMAKDWMNAGVDIIGGCCRVGPDQIKQLNKEFFS